MLITRPFSNAEVADLLQKEVAWSGIVAEACRRLRGEPGSGTPRHPLNAADCIAHRPCKHCGGTCVGIEDHGNLSLMCVQCKHKESL